MRAISRFVVVVAILASAVAARAEDAYYRIPIRDLTITEGALPVQKDASRHWRSRVGGAMLPRVVLDGPGEAYVGSEQGQLNSWMELNNILDQGRVHLRAPKGQDVTGRLFLPNEDWTGMVVREVSRAAHVGSRRCPPGVSRGETVALRGTALAGRPRRGMVPARSAAGPPRAEHRRSRADQTTAVRPPSWDPMGGDLAQTYALFSGGRAMSENLQLDRLVTPRGDQTPEALDTVALDTIRGITVEEIDWKTLIKDARPKLDPLGGQDPRRSARRVLSVLPGGRHGGRRGGQAGHAGPASGRAALGGRRDAQAV